MKAVFPMWSKVVKSAFVRTGEIAISLGEIEVRLAGRMRIVCSWTWSRPQRWRSTVMVSTVWKPCLRYRGRAFGVDSTYVGS